MNSDEQNEAFVYGVLDDNLVLIPEEVAQAVASDVQGIRRLRNYREARRFEPQLLMVPGLDDDDYDEVPEDEDPYDLALTSECQEGNWPPPIATFALDYLPDDLDIGVQREHFPGFPTLYIDPASEADVVETLRGRGYVARRDDHLISLRV